MNLQEFINENREQLTACVRIGSGIKSNVQIDDEEIEMWIMNDQGLYNWARSRGVEL